MRTPVYERFKQNLKGLIGLITILRDSGEARYAETQELSTAFDDASDFAFEWICVALVTMVETYLQDVLAFCAERDPKLMERSEQAVYYSDVLRAASIQELAQELRFRWSRNFIDRGGPTVWVERLTRMGARGYPDDLTSRLEILWGIRHVVVHNAGWVTTDFCLRHPEFNATVGEKVDVSEMVPRATKAVAEFVQTTDAFLVQRYLSSKSVE